MLNVAQTWNTSDDLVAQGNLSLAKVRDSLKKAIPSRKLGIINEQKNNSNIAVAIRKAVAIRCVNKTGEKERSCI